MRLKDLARFSLLKGRTPDGDRALATAPSPHPYFEFFAVALDRYFGLWRVVGAGRNIPMTVSRAAVRRVFTRLENPLIRAFGPGELSKESWPHLPDEPKALSDKKGMLERYWVLDRTTSPLIEGAVLVAYPSPDVAGRAYVRLTTTFRYYNPRLDKRRRYRVTNVATRATGAVTQSTAAHQSHPGRLPRSRHQTT